MAPAYGDSFVTPYGIALVRGKLTNLKKKSDGTPLPDKDKTFIIDFARSISAMDEKNLEGVKLKAEGTVKSYTREGIVTENAYSCVTMQIQAKNAEGNPVDVSCHEPFVKGDLPLGVLGGDQFTEMGVKVGIDYVNKEVTITKVGS